jgi:ferritin-like metal-binding protein YciE
MSLTRLDSLLHEYLQELHACEVQVVKEMPRLIDGALSNELRTLLKSHGDESARHEASLAAVLKQSGALVHGVRCRVGDALLKHALEVADMRGNSVLLDLSLILVLRQLESFERGLYESITSLAEVLERQDLVTLLKSCASDEDHMEQSLTVLGDDMMDSLQRERAHKGYPGVESPEGTSAV